MPHPAFPFLFAPLLASSSPVPAPQAPAAPTNDPSLAAMNQAAKEAEHPKKEYIDYGWQIWIANAVALVPFMGVFTTRDSELQERYLKVAGTLYFIPPATIHFAHGQIAYGFASVSGRAGGIYAGLRLLPAYWLAGHLGGTEDSESSGKGHSYVPLVLLLVATATAASIDAIFLAREEVTVRKSSIRLAPSFGWSADRPSFGLSGSW